MKRLCIGLLGILCLGMMSGCSSYIDGYDYLPRPGMIEVPPATQPSAQPAPPPVTTLSSIVGVRWADDGRHLPETVEVRMQVDNNSGDYATIDPRAMRLTNPELMPFGQAVIEPPSIVTIPPMQSAAFSVLFPFPAGNTYRDTDLESLQLRWNVQVAGRSVGQVVNFRRSYYYHYYHYYYDDGPYFYGPAPVWYGGVVIIHRR